MSASTGQLYTLTSSGWKCPGRGVLDTFVMGTTKPVYANTGLRALGRTAADLTPYPATGGPAGDISGGTLTISSAVTLDGYDIAARVNVTTAGAVKLHGCLVRGNSTLAANAALVTCSNAAYSALTAPNITIEYCDLIPDTPSIWWDGIIGHHFHAERNYIKNTVDGIGGYNANGGADCYNEYWGNCIDLLSFFSPDPNHSSDTPISKTHNDGIQIQGGQHHDFWGNSIQGFLDMAIGEASFSSTSPQTSATGGGPNNSLQGPGGYNANYPETECNGSALIVQQNVNAIGWISVRQNWFDGGQYTVNFVINTFTGPDGVNYVTGNRWGRNQGFDYPTQSDTTHTLVGGSSLQAFSSGNVYEDTGVPILWRS